MSSKAISRKKPSSPVDFIKSYITPKFLKDVKFGLCGFVYMCIILFHYAWIMRRWLLDPYMELAKIGIYFAFFFVHVIAWGFVFYHVFYKSIYAEEIAADRAQLEELKKR
ncbi:uncharacterized protein RJT21DRAFT_25545 [Scheffersomyces amazonensis]|uniref:uncharacterized protein n=1 Tax=Scheffersomyces amazonensis TaxID=1078765 RepID=UPI00315C9418